MPWRGPHQEGERPTLGWLVADFIKAHCAIPDGEFAGQPLELTEWQLEFLLAYYELHEDAMERQMRHMTRLVDDLMEVSRITRGKIELKWEEVPLDDIVRDAIDLSRPRMESKGHEFALHHDERNLVVLGDALRLTQVLSNLLSNACKFQN